MDGHIGRVHCRYRVHCSDTSMDSVLANLDLLAQQHVVDVLTDALDKVFGDDESVYVLRHVKAPVAFNLNNHQTDANIASRWGNRLAISIISHIAHDTSDSSNLVQFKNQAHYVSNFIVDLMRDKVWHSWIYHPFSYLKNHDLDVAIVSVLIDNRDHFSGILSNLHRDRQLEKLLQQLDSSAVNRLWSQGFGHYWHSIPESLRPFFISANNLMDRLNLWSKPSPGLSDLFHSYLRTGPDTVDWNERRSLSDAISDIFRFLNKNGFLIQVKDDLQPGFRKEMTKAISELDWLDRDRLQSSLLKILLQAETKGSNSFQRPVGFRLSPNQRQLLEDLTTALIDEELQLDKNHPDSSENVLRLYAALANRSPRWASDAWVSSLIKRLLSAWKVMRHSENPYDALSLIYEERLENAVKTFPDDFRPDAADAIKFLTGAGESGLELMEMLIKNSTGEGQPAMVSNYQSSSNRLPRFHSKDSLIGHSKKHTVSGDDGILHGTDQENDIGNMLETACAGVFLLLRSIQDIRLPMIVRDADFPRLKEKIPGACEPMQPLSVIMLSLAHLWTGRSSLADNKFDPGLTLFAGFDTPPSLGDLHKIWSRVSNKDCDRFQQFLLSTLAGLRFLRGSWVHLYQIPMNQKTALICGDAVGRLWPLGRIIQEKPEAKKIVSQWRHMWKTTTGRKLKLVSSDKILEDLVDLYIEDEKACNGLLGTEMSDCTENQKDLEVDYKDSREALVAALKVLNNKSFEIADVDLTMALTAIAILRVWARWLKQFSGSSVAYLLTNFIRRPGRIYNGESSILVEMDSKPVDIVLEMTGYTAKMDRLSWFGNRDVSYEIHSI